MNILLKQSFIMLEKRGTGDDVIPLLISVDPYRDTTEKLSEYVKEFHPKLIGLTGTPEEIKTVCKDYKIYNFVPENAEEADYLVDHSVFIFLMGPKGGFLEFFGPDKSEEFILEKIEERMKQENGETDSSKGLFSFFKKYI